MDDKHLAHRNGSETHSASYGVMFHYFDAQDEPLIGQGYVRPKQLELILKFVGLSSIVPAKEWLERAERGLLREGDVCLSFDDGLRCQVDYALPVLNKYNLTTFWFVHSSVFEGGMNATEVSKEFIRKTFSGFDEFYEVFLEVLFQEITAVDIEEALSVFSPAEYLSEHPFYSDAERAYRYLRDKVLGPKDFSRVMEKILDRFEVDQKTISATLWMDDENLFELAKNGHVVGMHSYSHPTNFKSLSFQEQAREYQKNFSHIYRVTGEKPKTMAHPVNSYNCDTLRILKDLGVTVGFRSNMHLVNHDGLEHPREDSSNILNQIKNIRQLEEGKK